jgi:hypothetical protein
LPANSKNVFLTFGVFDVFRQINALAALSPLQFGSSPISTENRNWTGSEPPAKRIVKKEVPLFCRPVSF